MKQQGMAEAYPDDAALARAADPNKSGGGVAGLMPLDSLRAAATRSTIPCHTLSYLPRLSFSPLLASRARRG